MSKPSYEVQKRYRDKAIRRVVIDLPKEMSEEGENHLNADGLTKSGFIKNAINEYLKSKAD